MTTPHTPPAAPDLAAIEARAAAATRGPWHADHEFGYVDAPVLMRGAIVCSLDSDLCDDTDGADAEFIAHAREDIPALLAHITALRAQHAADVAAAVAGERERCAAVCRDIASATPYDDAAQAWCDACAEAIDALTAPAAPTGGGE